MSRPEQFEHAAGAGAEIEQRAKRLVGERFLNRRLHRFVRDMQLADTVPFGGMGAKVSLRRGGARLPHRGEPRPVAGNGLIGGIEAIEQRARHRRPAARLGQPEEGPGALAIALDQPRLGQQPQMARDARLRLAQNVGQVGDGELGFAQQRQHAQTRFLARRLQRRIEGVKAKPGAARSGLIVELLDAVTQIRFGVALEAIGAPSHYIKISLYL